jgi:hypothetical protein
VGCVPHPHTTKDRVPTPALSTLLGTVHLVIWLSLLTAVLLVFTPLWTLTSFWGVYLHELGHTAAALLLRQSPRAIRLHADGSGHTEWQAHLQPGILAPIKLRVLQLVVLLSGYTAGASLALALAAALYFDLDSAAAVSLAVLATLSLFFTRGVRAVLVALATLLLALLPLLAPAYTALLLPTLALTAALASLRSAIALHATPLSVSDGSDPGELAALTHLPPRFWTSAFLVVNLVFAGASAALVLGWFPAR